MISCRQSGTGAGFLRVLRFPLPLLILPTDPNSLIVLSSTLVSTLTVSLSNQLKIVNIPQRNYPKKICMFFDNLLSYIISGS
jgi:hypothetical protein